MTTHTDKSQSRKRRRRAGMVLAAAVTAVEGAVVATRRGSLFAVDTVVRCRDGHVFTTLWIPGASFKAVRLGWWRFQRCPVGHHWALVTPVVSASLSEEDRALAAEHRDVRIP